jgi:predicted O-methyltransferase YrrM
MKQDGGPAWPTNVRKGPARFVSYLAIRDPRLLADYLKWFFGGGKKQSEPAFEYRGDPVSPAQAIETLRSRLGSEQSEGSALEHTRTAARSASSLGDRLQSMAGDTSLGELLYALLRAVHPEVVVETGVAQGITSAYILAALSDNGHGRLISIDLPSRSMIRSQIVGAAVPAELRSRWTYYWGSSRRLLRDVLQDHGAQVGLFVHDSDHSYENMLRELTAAWETTGHGTWIVADDVQLHNAFEDFARSTGSKPMYVSQDAKKGWTGLISKS